MANNDRATRSASKRQAASTVVCGVSTCRD